MEVTVVGSLMIDLITYADKLPKIGETVLGYSFNQSFGGKGSNQAVQCARLGICTKMVGFVGSDGFGADYIEQLKCQHVDTVDIYRSSALGTGTASIQVDNGGQNTIIIVQGANMELLPGCGADFEGIVRNSRVVLCQNEIPFETTQHILQLCKKNGVVAVLNPAPSSNRMLDLLPLCDLFCPNETELASLSGLPTDTDEQIQIAAETLIELGCETLLVTLGARGAAVVRRGSFLFYPTFHRVSAIDTVGAGDSFIGALAANIARAVPLSQAVPRAILCASLSVTKKGAQCSYPSLADLEQLSLADGRSGRDLLPPEFSSTTSEAVYAALNA